MPSPVSFDQDVVFTPAFVVPGTEDGQDADLRQAGPDAGALSAHLHRQAAQHRNGRLRALEALRRPRA